MHLPTKSRVFTTLGVVVLTLVVFATMASTVLATSHDMKLTVEKVTLTATPYYTAYSPTIWTQRTCAFVVSGNRSNNEVWLSLYSDGVLKHPTGSETGHWISVDGGKSYPNDFEPNHNTVRGKTRWWMQLKADLALQPDKTGSRWSAYY